MPNAAVVGTALNAFTIRKYGIYVGGLDVRPYTPIETVHVTEAGPGDVSQASFTIEDTEGVVPVPADGSEVWIWDLILNYPVFSGYLNDYKKTVVGVGRTIDVTAFGVEALLDWSMAPAALLTTFVNPSGTWSDVSVLASELANNTFATARLFAPELQTPTDVALRDGNATWPMGTMAIGAGFNPFLSAPLHDFPAGSFRTWLSLMSKYNQRQFANVVVPFSVTVDFYRRLRMFELGRRPADYSDLVVTDSPAGPLVASGLEYDRHPGDLVRNVYVNGTGAGAGWVSDGSGIFGRQAVIDDSTSVDANTLAKAAAAFFATQNVSVRGSFTLEDYSPPDGTVHPGCALTLTDATVSEAAQVYTIESIEKTFHGPLQTWRIQFGGRRPSIVDTLRNQYSSTRSWQTAAAA